MVDVDELKAAHQHSSRHREELERSERCGCFYCEQTFAPGAIGQWIGGDTARCPNCGIDSVIGDASGYALDGAFLRRMRQRWFG